MRLIRFGDSGREERGVLLPDGRRVDASGGFHEYDEGVFGGGGLEGLLDRLGEDTRTHQLETFMAQVPVTGLVSGMGPNAGYAFRDQPNYLFIDNQILFLLFKFGLPGLAGYALTILWPGMRAMPRAVSPEEKVAPIMLGLWILALLGISIFNAVAHNPSNYLIALLAGRCLAIGARSVVKPTGTMDAVRRAWSRA